jgi:carbonic anhydrase/acetyltransferase-like protein (isoleucine patch superfamily)
MSLYELDGIRPAVSDPDRVYLAPGAMVIGNVRLGMDVTFWPHAVARGDTEPISIGDGTNIQEHSMLHTDPGYPLAIGKDCTVGHRAILHGCTVGDNSLIGMGAVVLNGAVIGKNCLVGAGSLVTEGKQFPDNSLIVGSPARVVRTLDGSATTKLTASARHYAANGRRFKAGLSKIG